MAEKEIISCGIVVFRKNGDDQFEVLILDYGKFYSHPKGRIEPGEDFKRTAIRELHEETDLTTIIISSKPITIINYRYSAYRYTINKTVHFFAGIVSSKSQVVVSYEHQGFKWTTMDVARKLIIYDTDVRALEEAYIWIKTKKVANMIRDFKNQL
ncbi:MAG: NUDIX domain-containing protein [Candidatus Heimdallarchaeota archaeon]|nr:NUDIX domain-containing protein [Candidatus Heimdallarchaeota archaeon]